MKDSVEEDTTGNPAEIARQACRTIKWYKPDGSLKCQSMREVLPKMEADDLLELPSGGDRRIVRLPLPRSFIPAAPIPGRRSSLPPDGWRGCG